VRKIAGQADALLDPGLGQAAPHRGLAFSTAEQHAAELRMARDETPHRLDQQVHSVLGPEAGGGDENRRVLGEEGAQLARQAVETLARRTGAIEPRGLSARCIEPLAGPEIRRCEHCPVLRDSSPLDRGADLRVDADHAVVKVEREPRQPGSAPFPEVRRRHARVHGQHTERRGASRESAGERQQPAPPVVAVDVQVHRPARGGGTANLDRERSDRMSGALLATARRIDVQNPAGHSRIGEHPARHRHVHRDPAVGRRTRADEQHAPAPRRGRALRTPRGRRRVPQRLRRRPRRRPGAHRATLLCGAAKPRQRGRRTPSRTSSRR
jgi:hypothetical protein